MPEVSLYVALITAAAGIVGAAAAQIPGVVRDIRLADQERRERNANNRVQACMDLLSAAGDLRTQVMNASQYHGERMGDLIAEIRKGATAVELQAARVEFVMPRRLGEPADQLAKAAKKFAALAVAGTDMVHNEMLRVPDTAELDQAAERFREQAVNEIRS